MHSGTDPLSGSSSFASRRSAASTLPNFELPPPPLSQANPKFPPFGSLSSSSNNATGSGSVSSLGNLPTPPNTTYPGESSGNLASYQAKTNSYPNHYWSQSSGQQHGGYNGYPQSGTQWSSDRAFMNSNSMTSMMRGDAGRDVHNTGSNDMFHLPPFPTTLPSSGNVNLPAMAAVSQQPMHSGMLHQQIVNGMNPVSHDGQSQDPYSTRLPPTPSYFNQSQPSPPTQQQQGFSFSSAASPNSRSPLSSSNGHSARMSPLGQNAGEMQSMHAHSQSQSPPQYQRQFSQFGLPGVNGPVLTNLHTSNANLALVGGVRNNMMASFNSGQAASMQQMYGGVHQTHGSHMGAAQSEKPFKCDQCMQSFNRNHDLKRHKRIHLAVKPYPCGHCDKSFSRKDALKVSSLLDILWRHKNADNNPQRHMLVKGCGKAQEGGHGHRDRGSGSPESNGAGYDSGSSSPSMVDERRVSGNVRR